MFKKLLNLFKTDKQKYKDYLKECEKNNETPMSEEEFLEIEKEKSCWIFKWN